MAKRVLVVDDSALIRSNIRGILQREGFHVAGEAANGHEAVAQFKELRPDIVTMDVVMPEMDGIQATSAIVSDYPEAVIIMCSAMGQQALVVEAITAGARDFVIKPFQAARLVQAIERALES